MQNHSIHPMAILRSSWKYRQLIGNLIRQEVIGRYKGSMLGVLWSFFNPVFMLAVYTFVFSVVFKARWGAGHGESKFEFALLLFAGILVFNIFSECITRAPNLILQNPAYVKKVVFPLEILPIIILGAAFFHATISLIVLLIFSFFVFGWPPLTFMLFPLLMLPLSAFTLAGSWLLASLGVYLRDVSQLIGIVVTALMFLTPIFYPVSAIPERYQSIIYLNPLTFIVEQSRNILIFGTQINWIGYCQLTIVSVFAAWIAFAWFQKTRKGFADVL